MVHHRDGDLVPVELGVLDDGVFGDGARQVVLEEFLDLGGVRPGPAQEGRRLKGAAAGAHGEVLGVQDNARQQGLRLRPRQVGGVGDILEQLGDQLRGGGGVGLVVVEGGPFDIGGGPAVMVDDRDAVAGLQHLLGLDLLGAVGVHHHHQRAVVHEEQRLLGGEETVLILRQLHQTVGEHLGGGRARLLNDVGGDPSLPGDGEHTGGGADAVVVRGAVAHDEQAGGVGHQGGQGVGHDPALDLGALLRLLGAAAEELKSELVADDRLVAAPGQGHLNGQVGVLEQLLEGVAVHSDADGEGGGQAAGADHLVDGVQNVKFLVHEPGQVLLLEQEQVPVPLHAPEHAAGARRPGVQPGVDLRVNGGALVLREVFHQVLIVVQQQNRGRGPAGLVPVPGVGQLGHVHPVGGGQKAAAPLAGPHQMAVYQEAALPQLHLVGALALALQQPAGVEIGENRLQLGVKQVLLVAGELEKAVVGPDDVPALRPEDDHGQGGVHHGVLGGDVHIAGDVLNILGDLPAALVQAAAVMEGQQHHHRQFQHGQGQTEHGGGQSEQNQADKIELQAGLKQLGQFSIQEGTLLPEPWG